MKDLQANRQNTVLLRVEFNAMFNLSAKHSVNLPEYVLLSDYHIRGR